MCGWVGGTMFPGEVTWLKSSPFMFPANMCAIQHNLENAVMKDHPDSNLLS